MSSKTCLLTLATLLFIIISISSEVAAARNKLLDFNIGVPRTENPNKPGINCGRGRYDACPAPKRQLPRPENCNPYDRRNPCPPLSPTPPSCNPYNRRSRCPPLSPTAESKTKTP